MNTNPRGSHPESSSTTPISGIDKLRKQAPAAFIALSVIYWNRTQRFLPENGVRSIESFSQPLLCPVYPGPNPLPKGFSVAVCKEFRIFQFSPPSTETSMYT